MPQECRKGHLTFADVESLFLRLALSYARRTARLQRFGNKLLRHVLVTGVFGAVAFPTHVFEHVGLDADAVRSWKQLEGKDLVQEQDLEGSPGEDMLLRTVTTCPEVLAQPLSADVLTWDEQTTQLCHFLLCHLFDLPHEFEMGSSVMLTGMKNEWLNGAEGTVGETDYSKTPPRFWVHLNLPQSTVQRVAANNKTTGLPSLLVLQDNIMRWPGAADRFTLRMLQDKAVWNSGAKVNCCH
jgi:hypothetical protein